MIPSTLLEDNPFTWQNQNIINLSKYPSKCFDNNSIINFPEEAFYIFQTLNINNSLFCNTEYPSYPKYYLDVSHFFIKKKKLTIKADVYNIESKPLIDKFKRLMVLNPEFMKQVKMSASSYGKKAKKDGKKG